jgi:FMN phosphatase YigB (HAD superfamily)
MSPIPAVWFDVGEVSGHQPHEIASVGDRFDNDLRPAAEAGLRTVFVQRGPWGYIIYEPGTIDLELGSLSELPAALKTLPAD